MLGLRDTRTAHAVCVPRGGVPTRVQVTSDDSLGSVTFKLASVLVAPGQHKRFALLSHAGTERGKGAVTVKAEEMANCNTALALQLSGCKLPNKDGFFGECCSGYWVATACRCACMNRRLCAVHHAGIASDV